MVSNDTRRHVVGAAVPVKTHGQQIFGTFLHVYVIRAVNRCAFLYNIKVQNTRAAPRRQTDLYYIYIYILFGDPLAHTHSL